MKKKILLLSTALVILSLVQAADKNWIDVDFTRDSTMWKEAVPQMAVVANYSYQCTLFSSMEYMGHNFSAAFGRFGVSNYSYTPFNVEDLSEKFIYAVRLNNNDSSYWALPGTPDVGTIKINVICGNASGEGEINLQKYVSGEGATAVWENFEPAVKFSVPPHAFSTSSFVIEKKLNLSGFPKLRFKGPYLKNIHVFAVTVSKNEDTGVNENLMSKISIDVNNRSLKLTTDVLEYSATVFDLAGGQLGTLKKGETFTFDSAGVYLLTITTAEGVVTKKIAIL